LPNVHTIFYDDTKDVLRLLFQLLDYNDDEKLVQANLMDLLNDNLKQAGWAADVYSNDYVMTINLNNRILKPYYFFNSSKAREFIDIFDVLGYIYAGHKDIDFDTFSRIFQAKGVGSLLNYWPVTFNKLKTYLNTFFLFTILGNTQVFLYNQLRLSTE